MDLTRWLNLLAQLWLQRYALRPASARKSLPLDDKELRLIVPELRRLSVGLTRNRALAGKDYFSSPGSWGAYLFYFWPVSYAQAQWALADLPRPPRRVLELGSGAGPAGAACFDAGARHVTFMDRNPSALQFASQWAHALHASHATARWNPETASGSAWPREKFDLIILQHTLNELWAGHAERIHRRAELIVRLLSLLQPQGHVLVIEPALTPTSRELLQVRDEILIRHPGWVGPCLHTHPCPALQHPLDSCHQEWPWSPPSLVKTLAQQAGFKKKQLKASTLLLQAEPPQPSLPADDLCFRIVSEPLQSKNRRIRLLGCGPMGRMGLALKPEDVTECNRVFLSLRRGDVIRVHHALRQESGIRLLATSSVEIIRRGFATPPTRVLKTRFN